MDTDTNSQFPDLLPSSFYFRRDVRAADDIDKLREISFAIIHEHERLRAWCREQGLKPPKWMVSHGEAREKGWKTTG